MYTQGNKETDDFVILLKINKYQSDHNIQHFHDVFSFCR